jgi:hypothetical protein
VRTSHGRRKFLIDSNGKIPWVNLTEDDRVHARPQQVSKAFDGWASHYGC